ncbi:endonuclease/exonuclease/phosphatase (EEP) superfamily protein YafD [Frondihabitans sp. PhB188]|uniref:endonuclease/exonuclease/phosphatase family protein n=1 Tax=Frondihabitans sp. PhB188 TaxID=2485200 RepID=UPI000FBD5BD2|nr:endonuclease/exonuclease/phosphatase family protein [Frondihabitans sp. PhB188]ROQ38436.1 endonuclease/exonuclease/phosphatase (EEP) superfamily protein YafD [Frondihabitans sp. PhB188]
MLRRFVTLVLLLAVAAVLAVAAFPQALGLQQHYYVAQIIAFRGVMGVVALVLAVILLVVGLAARPLRRLFTGVTVLLVAFAAVSAGVLIERGTGSTEFAKRQTGDLRVLAWNTRGAAPGAAAIASLAISTKADIVSLPETQKKTAAAVAAAMKKAGRPMRVLVLAYDQTSSADSTSLLISTKLGSYTTSTDKTTTDVLPTVVARPADGTGPVIVAAHPVAPVKAHMAAWSKDLKYLAKLCSGESMIMAGDFNSTLDHESGLGKDATSALGSCRDAAKATGNAAVGTWPTNVPELLATPIDHVMATPDWKVTGFKVIGGRDDAGSDHRPVLAQLVSKNQ